MIPFLFFLTVVVGWVVLKETGKKDSSVRDAPSGLYKLPKAKKCPYYKGMRDCKNCFRVALNTTEIWETNKQGKKVLKTEHYRNDHCPNDTTDYKLLMKCD